MMCLTTVATYSFNIGSLVDKPVRRHDLSAERFKRKNIICQSNVAKCIEACKSPHTIQEAYTAEAYSGLFSIMRLMYCYPPLPPPPSPLRGWDASVLLLRISQNFIRFSLQFAATHLYSWVKRGTVRVKCLTQEHNACAMTPAKARAFSPGIQSVNNKPKELGLRIS